MKNLLISILSCLVLCFGVNLFLPRDVIWGHWIRTTLVVAVVMAVLVFFILQGFSKRKELKGRIRDLTEQNHALEKQIADMKKVEQ